MAKRRRSIQLQPNEDKVLRSLYVEFGIPSDRFPQQPDDLEKFMSTWHFVTDRQDSSAEVLHYMFTQRKQGLWPKLGRSPKGISKEPSFIDFSEEELRCLDEIYEDMQIASDNFALDDEVAKKFQAAFAKKAGRIVPTSLLSAAVIKRRKGGTLETLRPKSESEDVGFGDIDQVAG